MTGPVPCPPPYSSIRPEERYCRVTESLYTALDRAYDELEERILLRTLDAGCSAVDREPSAIEAQNLAKFEQVFKTIYFDKEAEDRSELQNILHRNLRGAVNELLGTTPRYTMPT